MKKITFLVFVFLTTFLGHAQLPMEGFEGTWTAGSGPAGWSIINVAGPAQTWQQGNGGTAQPAYEGTHCAYLNKENVTNGTLSEDWLVTPSFLVPSNPQLHFFSRLTQNIDQGTLYKVMIGEDIGDLTTWTEVINWTELTLNPDQQEYLEKIVTIPATYVGANKRIAFVMMGDDGDRWLIDNVSVVQQCNAPTNLTATGVTATGASLSWTDVAGSGSWEIELMESTATPTGSGVTYNGTLPYAATGLTASTTYKYYVRSLCQPAGNNSPWSGPYTFSTVQVPADLNFTATFETANNGFTIVNGTQTNKWVIGNATSSSPSYSMYISNDNGVSNAYTNSAASVVHAYRDINIPVGAVEMNLSFDWKNLGETGWDYIRVWNTPTTYTPAAGTQTATTNGTQIGANFVGNSSWSTYSNTMNVSAWAGTTRRFIFEWRDDTSGGSNPPGALDNIAFTLITCSQPTTLAVSNLTATGATLAWTNVGTATSWEVYAVSASDPAPTAASTGVITTTNPYVLSGLTAGTNYKFYVRGICGPGSVSLWSGPTNFSTTQIPATLPYVQDFEVDNGFNFVNGTQPNVWFYGTAVSSSPTHSVYVTNDGGVTNGYTTSAASVVHAYRDIAIPAGTGDVNFSFDWHNLGETGWDYIRVWVVPVTYTPVAGTQTTTANGIQLGANFVGNANWSTYSSIFSASAYAGSTMRLVFEWRSDTSGGTNPPGAIDNVNVSAITCSQPTALTVSNLSATGATLGWTNSGTATSWEVYAVPAGDPAPTAATVGVVTTTNPYVLSGLTAGTNYKFYVRAICGPGSVSLWSGPLNFSTTQVPATLPYTQDYETDNGFTFVNGTNTNVWFYGTAVSSSPTHSIYITNDGGVTNGYNTSINTVVHAYRDFTVPAGTTDMNFSFDWHNLGETGWDYIRVWAVPVTYTPVAGTQTTTANGTQLGANFVGNANWSTYSTIFNASAFAGSTMRLVFEWRSDTSGGTNPPGAVDNVNLSVITCPQPTALVVSGITESAATIGWTNQGTAASWEVYVVAAGGAAPTASSTGTVVTTNPYTLTGLTSGSNYTVYVRAICSPTDSSFWSGPLNFSTTQIPATLPYNQDFETTNDLNIINGTQPNIWFYGTAVSSSPTHSLYVTNDGGVTNGYNSSAQSIVHAYRDIAIPAGAVEANLSFDWHNLGEVGWDYVRVWIVPVTYTPVAGVQTGTANGTQIGANFVGNANWSTYSNTFNVSAFAGTTVRLVFEWRNDTIFGSNPAGAIDNISVIQITCPQPLDLVVNSTTTTEAVVQWTNQGTAASWEVYVVPVSDPAPTAASTGTVVTENPYTITGLDPSTSYKVYVRAICSATDSSLWTGPVNFDTDDLCPAPTDVAAHCLDDNSVTFDWTPGGNETSWEVAVVPVADGIPTSGTVVTATSYYYEGLTLGTDYTFYVRAVCADIDGFSSWATLDFSPQVESAANAQALCAGILAQPQDSNYGGTVPAYGQVGCLFSTPNPTWYYVTLGGTGEVVLNLTQTSTGGTPIDVDFAAFGPFTSLQQACYEIGNPPNTAYIVDCSYSASATETINVTGTPGQVFALLVTNFNGSQGTTTITQTSGPDVSCVPTVDLGPDQTLCGTDSYNLTATVNNPGAAQVYTYQWFEDTVAFTPTIVTTTLTSQTITVTDPGSHVYSVIVTMPIPVNNDPVTDQATIALSPAFTVPTPTPLALCGSNGTATVDLAAINFLGTLNPADYVLVGIYTTQSAANTATSAGAIDTSVPFTATTQTLYVVVADVNLPQCKQIVQLSITVSNSATATIAYAGPYCDNGPDATVTQTGNAGGVYTAAPAGLTINAATGTIDVSESTAGTYTVTYTLAATATCPEFTTTATVEILAAPEATIAYSGTPYCNSAGTAVVTLTGTTGGVYSSDADLVINPATGEVDLVGSTVGSHTVTYTIAANGPCAAVVVTTEIVINAAFAATIDYGTTPFCTNGGIATVTQGGDAGGTYSSTDGLVINATTGEITLASTPGTYTVTYTIPANESCQEFSTTATVTIEAAPTATYSYDASPYCSDGGIATVTFSGTTGGVFSAVAGLSINPATGEVDLAASTAGTYDVYYDVAATTACGAQQFGPASITITALPVATISYANSPYCSNAGIATVTFSGNAGGTYSATPAGLVIDPSTGEVTLATSVAGTYNVVYTIAAAAGCHEVVSAPAQIVITTLPIADFQYEFATFCTNAANLSPVFVGGGVAGVFTADNAGLAIDSATGVINAANSQPGTYIVTNTIIPANGCTPAPVTQVVTVTPAPVATFTYPATGYCVEGAEIPEPVLDGDAGTFTSTPAGLVIDAATGIIDLDASTPGTYTVINTITGTTECPTVVSDPVTVSVVSLPVVAVTQGCDGTQYTLTLSLTDDPVYSADNVTIEWTSPTGTTLGTGETQVIAGGGTYQITVTPDAGIACPVKIDIPVDDTICEIPRGISPNDDNKNDTFDLTGYGVTKLVIFNRYGKEVYSHHGLYTNEFKGTGGNGDQLPTGTYFYMLVRNTGESKTGWVYINREE